MTTENAIQRIERAITAAEHKPGQWCQAMTRMGGLTTYNPETMFDGLWGANAQKEVCWASFEFKRDSWLAAEAVNSLPPLLQLVTATLAWRDSQTKIALLNAIESLIAPVELPAPSHGTRITSTHRSAQQTA